jgi:hypothetical protein
MVQISCSNSVCTPKNANNPIISKIGHIYIMLHRYY